MKTVRVDLGDRGYDVLVGVGLSLGDILSGVDASVVLIVSDENVDALYGDACESQLLGCGVEVFRYVVPAGEESKAIDKIVGVYDTAIERGLDRGSMILALGGGVVGDLAGFAAATFMRGIRYVQVPTSLLAMVDSSVGGKTGVNIVQGKNLVGAFYQPVVVAADIDTLDTLPEREFGCGLAEVVKYGLIWDADLFDLLESKAGEVLKRDKAVLIDVVARCCEIKAEVVSQDEKESGLRAILNYGHTLGHAIEKVMGFGVLLHGEALAIGLIYASRVSERVHGFASGDTDRLVALLSSFGLPVGFAGKKPSWEEIRRAIAVDKKTVGSVPKFVLSDGLGSVLFGCDVSDSILEEVYDGIS